MSESLEKSRQATSGWRRISIAAISALLAFILARIAIRPRPALPEGTRQVESADEAADSHFRLRMQVTMVSAPPDFASKVLARVATTPTPERHVAPVRPVRISWFRSIRIVAVTLSVALVLMLLTGVFVTLVNPSLAVAILDAVISLAVALLAFGRMIGQLISRAAATPWMIPVAMGALLGFLLFSWTQLARQFGRDPQEA